MRPAILNPLFADASGLKGVGPRTAKLLGKLLLGGDADTARIVDLLFHLPRGVVDRRYRCTISQLPEQGIVTLEVTATQYLPPPVSNSRIPYKVEVSDDTGSMMLVFFKAFPDSIKRLLPLGEKRLISGEITWFNATPQMNHPDYVVPPETADTLPAIEPQYPLTAGLAPKIMAKAEKAALAKLPHLPEWQDAAWLARQAWPGFRESLLAQHDPQSVAAADLSSPPRARLAYDELLANQLALALIRRSMRRARGRPLQGDRRIGDAILSTLPFQLTPSQRVALAEISADMASQNRMIRLLQGDVGSGKTVVALLALATAVEAGTQGAFMAPTEILARQHLATLQRFAGNSGLQFSILTGREKGRSRADVLERLANGGIDILIGTHALFQEGVTFKDLGLAVIDEQHRFGVHQRLALQDKASSRAHVLVMTATPIPRTLALTAYGDMDVSKLTEKPAGRLPVSTRIIGLDRMEEVVAGLSQRLASGARAYWVCPLVAENADIDLAAAEARFDALKAMFGAQVGLVHGQLRPTDKDRVMEEFKNGAKKILVSTTVIEVGVDVPEASVMIIENAERFGLAQLHQLRGRVGRGSAQSVCILLYQEPLGETAKARLQIMRETEDGFRIAEEDLRLRGAGEVLGTQQSGLPEFRLADLSVHGDLLVAAKDDASLVLARDAELTSQRGEALRVLLYLFERNEAAKLLSAG